MYNNQERGSGHNFNRVALVGKFEAPFQYDHSVQDEVIFSTYIQVRRTSGTIDRIPVCIKEKYLESAPSNMYDKKVRFEGIIISARRNNKNILCVKIVSEITVKDENAEDINSVFLEGYISTSPVLRTISDEKSICEFKMFFNRAYGKKCSNVPVITWNQCARAVSTKHIGTKVFVFARFQSRKTIERVEDGIAVEQEVYELSAYKLTFNGRGHMF